MEEWTVREGEGGEGRLRAKGKKGGGRVLNTRSMSDMDVSYCPILLCAERGDVKEAVEGLPLFGWLREAFLRK